MKQRNKPGHWRIIKAWALGRRSGGMVWGVWMDGWVGLRPPEI